MAGDPPPAKRPREDDENADYRALKRPHLDYTHTGIISVFVGRKEKHFIVHKDAICIKSKFFKTACSKRWREGKEKIVRLPEVKVKAFESYINWAYSDTLVAESTVGHNVDMMIDLNLLGDKLEDIKLRNKTLKALHSYATIDKIQPGAHAITEIWRGTPPSSLLRKWALDVTISRLGRKSFEDELTDYPSEFVRELALKALQQIPTIASKEFQAKLPLYLEVDEEV